MRSEFGRAAVAAVLTAAIAAGAASAKELAESYRVLRSSGGSFILRHPPHLEPMAREIAGLLEESADEIAGELGLETIAPISVHITDDARVYRSLHGDRVPEWSAAFSAIGEQVLGIDALKVGVGPRPMRAVVRHELSHLLLAQRVGSAHLPTWFMEGLAMIQAGEWRFADEWNLVLLAGRLRLPYLEELDGPFPRPAGEAALAYGLSYKAVTELLQDRSGSLMTLTAFVRDRGDFEDAFFLTFGMTPYDFASRFYVGIHERYRTPGVILNAGPYWLVLALLFVSAFAVKRVRTQRRLREMEARELGRGSFFG